MRRILLCCAVVLGLAACGRSSNDGSLSVNEESNGTSVAMTVGEQLTVTLTSLGDGGFSNWTITTAPDPTVLTSITSHHQDPGPGAMPGNFGQDIFEFRAVGAGETSLVASAVRSWSGEAATFALTVTVN